MLHQAALPPHRFTCGCGASWLPANARGKPHPTEASLQREAEAHFKQCRPPLVDKGTPPADQDGGRTDQTSAKDQTWPTTSATTNK